MCAIGSLFLGMIGSFMLYIFACLGLLFLLLLPIGGAIIGIQCVLVSSEQSNKEKAFFIIGIILLAGYIFYQELSGILSWLGENYDCEL